MVKSHWGVWSGLHATVGFVSVRGTMGLPMRRLVVVGGFGVGVVAYYEVQYGPWRGGCLKVTGPTCAWHALEVMGDLW